MDVLQNVLGGVQYVAGGAANILRGNPSLNAEVTEKQYIETIKTLEKHREQIRELTDSIDIAQNHQDLMEHLDKLNNQAYHLGGEIASVGDFDYHSAGIYDKQVKDLNNLRSEALGEVDNLKKSIKAARNVDRKTRKEAIQKREASLIQDLERSTASYNRAQQASRDQVERLRRSLNTAGKAVEKLESLGKSLHAELLSKEGKLEALQAKARDAARAHDRQLENAIVAAQQEREAANHKVQELQEKLQKEAAAHNEVVEALRTKLREIEAEAEKRLKIFQNEAENARVKYDKSAVETYEKKLAKAIANVIHERDTAIYEQEHVNTKRVRLAFGAGTLGGLVLGAGGMAAFLARRLKRNEASRDLGKRHEEIDKGAKAKNEKARSTNAGSSFDSSTPSSPRSLAPSSPSLSSSTATPASLRSGASSDASESDGDSDIAERARAAGNRAKGTQLSSYFEGLTQSQKKALGNKLRLSMKKTKKKLVEKTDAVDRLLNFNRTPRTLETKQPPPSNVKNDEPAPKPPKGKGKGGPAPPSTKQAAVNKRTLLESLSFNLPCLVRNVRSINAENAELSPSSALDLLSAGLEAAVPSVDVSARRYQFTPGFLKKLKDWFAEVRREEEGKNVEQVTEQLDKRLECALKHIVLPLILSIYLRSCVRNDILKGVDFEKYAVELTQLGAYLLKHDGIFDASKYQNLNLLPEDVQVDIYTTKRNKVGAAPNIKEAFHKILLKASQACPGNQMLKKDAEDIFDNLKRRLNLNGSEEQKIFKSILSKTDIYLVRSANNERPTSSFNLECNTLVRPLHDVTMAYTVKPSLEVSSVDVAKLRQNYVKTLNEICAQYVAQILPKKEVDKAKKTIPFDRLRVYALLALSKAERDEEPSVKTEQTVALGSQNLPLQTPKQLYQWLITNTRRNIWNSIDCKDFQTVGTKRVFGKNYFCSRTLRWIDALEKTLWNGTTPPDANTSFNLSTFLADVNKWKQIMLTVVNQNSKEIKRENYQKLEDKMLSSEHLLNALTNPSQEADWTHRQVYYKTLSEGAAFARKWDDRLYKHLTKSGNILKYKFPNENELKKRVPMYAMLSVALNYLENWAAVLKERIHFD